MLVYIVVEMNILNIYVFDVLVFIKWKWMKKFEDNILFLFWDISVLIFIGCW